MISLRFSETLLGLSALAWLVLPVGAGPDLGRQIYEGKANSGVTVVLESAGLTVDAARFPCSKCHGPSGLGTREANSAAPPLLPSLLFAAGPPDREARAEALRGAVVEGESLAGGVLSSVMPRYSLPKGAENALLEFLEDMEARQRSGVSSSAVRFGVFVSSPPSGPELALFQSLSEAAAKTNDGKPVHGRRIEIVRLDPRTADGSPYLNDIFAVLALSTRSAPLLPSLDAAAVPVLFPLTETGTKASTTSLIASREEWTTAVIEDAKARALGQVFMLDQTAIQTVPGLTDARQFAAGRRTAVVLTTWQQVGALNALPLSADDVVYIATPDPYATAAEIKQSAAPIIIVDRFPMLAERALASETTLTNAYAETALELIAGALAGTGRFVTRDAFLASLDRVWARGRQPPVRLQTGDAPRSANQ